MTKTDIEKALTVLEGIRARDADLAAKYIHPERYVEHNPDAADGVEGLREYIKQFSPLNHSLHVVRAFQDGSYVFAQEDGQISGQNTFFDVFRFEDGLIVEHWIFSAEAAPPNQTGHTPKAGIRRRMDRRKQSIGRTRKRTSRSCASTTKPSILPETTAEVTGTSREI